ncbi:MAG TPA: peptidase domain-containing ABC transporter [Thermoanaerobaculia bacterium]|nr:peptidase domain-containing ABC transporter [Thermoanaerobaculia bacterium]
MNDETVATQASLFRFFPAEHQERVRSLFRKVSYDFGDVIVRQGDPADAFYILSTGRARVIKTTARGEEIALNVLRPGSEFGESALLAAEPRTASVRCSTMVEALRLSRDDFTRLVAEYPELRGYLETTQRYRTLHRFLYEFSNFGRLPEAALSQLMERLTPVAFSAGQRILTQGEPAGPMYVVQSGKVRVFEGGNGRSRALAFYSEGEFFGELSILNGSPRAASAEAVTDCTLLALPPETVLDLRRQFPEFEKLLDERLAQYHFDREARVPLDFATELLPADTQVAEKVGPEQAEEEPPEPGRKRARIRKFPFVQQIDEMDCGPAALAMICRHFGRNVSLARIRRLCFTSTDGTTLKAICGAANELGLAARALKVSARNLADMPVPAIVHWEGNHWLVVFDVGPKYVRVADPAMGIRRIPRAEFEQRWTGYAALFDYTEAFARAPESRAGIAWLVPFFKPHRAVFLQVFLLAGIVTLLQLLFPVFTQTVVDKVIVEHDLDLLNVIVIGMLVALGFMMVSNFVQQWLLSFAAVRIDSAILDHLTRKLLALPLSYFNNRRTGDIQRRLAGATQVRQFAVQQGVGGALALVSLVGALGLMAFYSIKLAMVVVVTAPLYGALMFLSVRLLRPVFAEVEESQGRYSSHQIDAIKGIEAVKAASAEQTFRDAMLGEFIRVSTKMFRGSFVVMTYESMVQLVGILATALFLWLGARMVVAGEISVGVFVAFSSLIAMAFSSVMRTLGIWDEYQLATVMLERLNDIFEQEPEQGEDRSALIPVPSLEGAIEVRDVEFRYGGPESPQILSGINLDLAPGKTVALVGRSGCGKTTLVKLLAGLLEPTAGTIHYDRVDMRRLNYRDLRRQIGLVLQDSHMFDETILRNIAFGDAEPDFDRVLWASQLANAHDFIMRLPLGYETRIGETGLALSGGQKQRISIARAVYNDPPILIFDEATSALDSESERAIQQNLAKMMAGRSAVIIAHRLSTIRDADQIVVLERGAVVETGTHDELMAARGLYFYLASQQLGL